jgi:hypothetical protein
MRKIEELLRKAAFWVFYRPGGRRPYSVTEKDRADAR